MTRKDYNLHIVEMILTLINKHPDLRFEQILSTLELGYNFYRESDESYILVDRIMEKLK